MSTPNLRWIVRLAPDLTVSASRWDGATLNDQEIEERLDNYAHLRAFAEHIAQLLYDANGDPIDGWEDVAEIHQALPGCPGTQEVSAALAALAPDRQSDAGEG